MLDASALSSATSEAFTPARPSRALRLESPKPRAKPLAKLTAALTDSELGQALIDCHPDAVLAAWKRYAPMVRSLLRRSLGTDAEVDDVVQDIFICFFKRAHALRDPTAVRPFLIGITRHTLHRERRRRARRGQLLAAYAPTVLHGTDRGNTPAGGYALVKMRDLLQQLSEQERASWVLRFAHGMTLSEVAQALGVSEPTAKRRLSRARANLSARTTTNVIVRDYVRGLGRDAISALSP